MLKNEEKNDMSHISLVVLAFPGSLSLAINVFSESGVEHVISFG
jgi:hypothetical protein